MNNYDNNIFPQAGSDEVGTGDFFGPVVVCAAHVDQDDIKKLNLQSIQDSKKITDELIMKMAPQLIQQLRHQVVILDNKNYNLLQKTHNLNAMKAILHNQALLNLKNSLAIPMNNVIVDQFAKPDLYYRYLQNEREVFNKIHFETKAESKYLSVACASMIARYHFIIEMDKLCKKYEINLPKGAGNLVDVAGHQFILKHGKDELINVCKLHFKNIEKINQM